MRSRSRIIVLAMICALAFIGCSGTTEPPAVSQIRSPMPVSDESVVTVNFDALKPYFDASHTNFPGVLISRDGQVLYIEGNTEVSLPLDPDARVLGVYDGKVLLSDKDGSYWFDWSSRRLDPIPELPRLAGAAFRGDTILVSVIDPWQVCLWEPGERLTALDRPVDVFTIAGVSISPDERYAVVVYDRDVVNGPRVCEIWVYDIETGEIITWPPNAGKVAGSYYIGLLGWVDDHTVRFMMGRQNYYGCFTWTLPNDEPEKEDQLFWFSSGPVTVDDGKWILYGPIPERLVLQASDKGNEPITVANTSARGIDCHTMLNGNLAISVYDGHPLWFEVTANGTLKTWGRVDWLY